MNEIKTVMKEALTKARSGDCKYKIFDEFKETLGQSELATQLSYIPDIKLKNKYRILNNILITLLSVVGFLNIINLISNYKILNNYIFIILAFKILITATFIYLVVINFGLIYKIISMLTIIEFLNSKPLTVLTTTNTTGVIVFIIILLIPIISTFLQFKMFPYLGLFKIQKDSKGLSIFTSEERIKL